MSVTNKALWVIERNLNRDLSLSEIAGACQVSRYHLAHAFADGTGRAVMDYVRGRRLSEAAKALADGSAANILDLALDTGYGSHEAFSRAFRAQFGLTPEALRERRALDGIELTQAIKPRRDQNAPLDPPRFETAPPATYIGLSAHTPPGATQAIARQWQNFMMNHYGAIEGRVRDIPVGIACNLDDEGAFDYLTAVETRRGTEPPRGLIRLDIPTQAYAVFEHAAHISTLNRTFDSIWNDWLPASGRALADAAVLEIANPAFDPRTGDGGETIWIPLVE